jgi:transcriptional regulator with XRE-family HTH domain
MNNQSGEPQIAARIREMREIMELSCADVAARLDISEDLYRKYENEEATLPVSTIYALAGIFGVDFTTLLTGEAPRMGGYTLVRAGQGIQVSRNPEYHFQSLAFNFKGRTMEPMIVALEPGEKPAALVTHNGQEFNIVLEGSLKLVIGTHEFILNQGDSIYFDPSIPHAQHATDVPAKFLTVIQ